MTVCDPEIMVSRVFAGTHSSSVAERLRSWPRQLHVADMFSGAGTFHKVMEAIVHALKKNYAASMTGVEAGVEHSQSLSLSLN